MNRKYYILTFSILAFILTTAVLLFRSKPLQTVQIKEQSIVENYYLTNDTNQGALRLELNVEIPTEYKDRQVLKTIQNAIFSNMFGEKYLNDDKDSVLSLFAKKLKYEYKLNNADLVNHLDSQSFYSFNNDHVLDGFTLLSDENVYSYGISRYVYMGGAHGLSTLNYFNFDLKKGKLITEEDLFKAGYEKPLSDIIKAKIIEDSYQDDEIPDIVKLEDTDYNPDSIKGNGNFFINEESINYVYNTYEIGPYYLGITEVNIPFERIRHLLKSGNPIEYLYHQVKTKK